MLLRVKSLTLAANKPFLPVVSILAVVVKLLYPIPEFITTVSVKTPSVIIGLIIAPVPPPVDSMTILGNELYCEP